jgi:hypothetical protein
MGVFFLTNFPARYESCYESPEKHSDLTFTHVFIRSAPETHNNGRQNYFILF